MRRFLRRMVVGWILFVGLFSWLPLVRSVFDGDSYQWGTTFFGIALSGSGLSGDTWVLVLKSALAVFVLYALLRRWRPLAAVLATAWTAVLLGDNLQSYLLDPEGLVFHGDTLGVRINLTLIAPIVSGAMLVLCLFFWRQSVELGAQAPHALQPVNLKRLALLAALLPIQFCLLRFGVPHGLTDQVGVVLTMLQWFAAGWALALPSDERLPARSATSVDVA